MLVVEDDASIRGLVQVILEDEGLEVFEAADGEEGLRLARELDPAVVVLDVMMPGLGGPEVIAELRRPDGSLPFGVLVLTGAPEVVGYLRDELGPDAVMEKPSTSGRWPPASARWPPQRPPPSPAQEQACPSETSSASTISPPMSCWP